MTLGRFFRDYVYIPLGGSRCRKNRLILNLMIVWLITGLWHGNGLNYLLWGAVLGLFIICLLYTSTEPGKNDPSRDRSVEENLELFEKMKNGGFADGERTLRAKIDMASPLSLIHI